MWLYEQATGNLGADAHGYSGYGMGRNNPAMQSRPGLGPIPRGRWAMVALRYQTEEHGPFVIVLEPLHGTETFGRSGFLIHGDSLKSPGDASHGCLVFSRDVRERLWASADRVIEVV